MATMIALRFHCLRYRNCSPRSDLQTNPSNPGPPMTGGPLAYLGVQLRFLAGDLGDQ